jgi:threonine/homoserine/homoserine lactone efflux protein
LPLKCSDGISPISLFRSMLETLVSFAGIAVLVSLTPGPATALVVRSAAVHGRREALLVTLGNSTGIFMWAIASVLGISALVAASETAFWVLKIVGAVVLLYLGIRALRGSEPEEASLPKARTAYGNGVMTSFANPKLAVFFIALFPQFVPNGDAVLPTTLAMALLLIAVDLVYFSLLALVVARAHRTIVSSRLARRIERVTGAVMIALGVRVALERRIS